MAYKILSLAAGLATLTTVAAFATQTQIDDGSAPAVAERPTRSETSAPDPHIMFGNDLSSGNVWEDRPDVRWFQHTEKGP